MEQINCRTVINRGTADFSPSSYEIYYRHFKDVPHYTHITGITDRYSDYVYDSDSETELSEDLPAEGIKYLNHEMNLFKNWLKSKPIFADAKITEYYFADHENNAFIVNLVLPQHNTIIYIRVAPNRLRTLTGFTTFSDSYSRPGMDLLREYANQYIAPPPAKKDKIHIITNSGTDFSLRDIKLGERLSKFSYDNYNEGFEEVSERIIETLKKSNESGLVLFHGDPGTGKTSYLKHLLRVIDNKKLIYMPPDLTEHLSSPGFVTFMMAEAKNSVLLIEDAENVLRHREAGGSQAVSNILNLSDGILGDVLQLQMVCTFNSRLQDIDEALLRPGRCIAEYRFENLEAERAATLMQRLYGDDVELTGKPMTLAEIYNYKKPKDRTKQRNYGVGFTAQL
jgi:hypothetical protein